MALLRKISFGRVVLLLATVLVHLCQLELQSFLHPLYQLLVHFVAQIYITKDLLKSWMNLAAASL